MIQGNPNGDLCWPRRRECRRVVIVPNHGCCSPMTYFRVYQLLPGSHGQTRWGAVKEVPEGKESSAEEQKNAVSV